MQINFIFLIKIKKIDMIEIDSLNLIKVHLSQFHLNFICSILHVLEILSSSNHQYIFFKLFMRVSELKLLQSGSDIFKDANPITEAAFSRITKLNKFNFVVFHIYSEVLFII